MFEMLKTRNQFFQGCAAASCKWGGQINNICVVYNRGLFFDHTVCHETVQERCGADTSTGPIF